MREFLTVRGGWGMGTHECLRNKAVRFGYNYMLKAARKVLNQPAL